MIRIAAPSTPSTSDDATRGASAPAALRAVLKAASTANLRVLFASPDPRTSHAVDHEV